MQPNTFDRHRFDQISHLCDELLLAPGRSTTRAAIPWLHVLSEHPVHLQNYEDLFDKSGPKKLGFIRQCINTFYALRPRFKCGFSKYFEATSLPRRADVVFVSHLLNELQVNSESDFYFGRIPKVLQYNGYDAVVALINHTEIWHSKFIRKFKLQRLPRLIFSKHLGWVAEIGLLRTLRAEAAALRQSRIPAGDVLRARVSECAAVRSTEPHSLFTLRLYAQVREVIKLLHPSAVVTTFEGHAWERIVFAAARSVDSSIRCVGYQHATIYARQHAMRRPLGQNFDPDLICASGDIPRSMLAPIWEKSGVPVVTVGTHRVDHAAVALTTKCASGNANSCLVLPDGTLEECLTILNFVLEVANQAKDIRFIIRMHPVMPFSRVIQNDSRLNELPFNITLSDRSIDEDFARCRWAIYRGSGAAIRAVIAGLRPFYFQPDGETLSIDPLYPIKGWRWRVRIARDIVNRIRRDRVSNPVTLASELSPALDFCNKYFSPLDVEKFLRYVTEPR